MPSEQQGSSWLGCRGPSRPRSGEVAGKARGLGNHTAGEMLKDSHENWYVSFLMSSSLEDSNWLKLRRLYLVRAEEPAMLDQKNHEGDRDTDQHRQQIPGVI